MIVLDAALWLTDTALPRVAAAALIVTGLALLPLYGCLLCAAALGDALERRRIHRGLLGPSP